ncbi:GNAT family N-acetyltransferase [Flexibacterium corallicola]|uniref:GNAT family N-acetyltransferase n=1 Tax=Flexibacterium corallicola TaxID=3037259 RepID=UPI00286F04EE|nr:GNAT family N-acetyltransferase [Pseudovibrio sp. M1P-2-3]
MNFPELKTKRLVLRENRLSDAENMVKYLNNFEVSRWLAVVPYPYTEKDAQERIKSVLANNYADTCAWAIDDGTGLVGTIGFRSASGKVVFGYFLGQPFWGKGYMSEAVQAVMVYLFETKNISAVYAGAFVENEGSQRVLAKAGFTRSGRGFQNCRARDGKEFPENRYMLTREAFVQCQELREVA